MGTRTDSVLRRRMALAVLLLAILTTLPVLAEAPQGMYFGKKEYVAHPLPTFAETRDKLPEPVFTLRLPR